MAENMLTCMELEASETRINTVRIPNFILSFGNFSSLNEKFNQELNDVLRKINFYLIFKLLSFDIFLGMFLHLNISKNRRLNKNVFTAYVVIEFLY